MKNLILLSKSRWNQASYSVFECPSNCPGPARYCDGVCRRRRDESAAQATFPGDHKSSAPITAEELPAPEGLDRFGHSLEFDSATGTLWLFGGYSPVYGPLNDVREAFAV